MLASRCDIEARRFAIRSASTGKNFHTRFRSCLRCASEVFDFWWAVLGSNQWPLPCESDYAEYRRLCASINQLK